MLADFYIKYCPNAEPEFSAENLLMHSLLIDIAFNSRGHWIGKSAWQESNLDDDWLKAVCKTLLAHPKLWQNDSQPVQ